MAKICFTKMHGCGNDYVYVDTMRFPIASPESAARRWSDRHTGIGSDGLVLIGSATEDGADFSMRIFNADGSEGMMCGNAARCIGKYLFERGLTEKQEIRLQTLSGIKTLWLSLSPRQVGQGAREIVDKVTVDMGEPVFDAPTLFLPERADGLTGYGAEGVFVSMGNPHYVLFTKEIDQVVDAGPLLEGHQAFPQLCNIEFARVESLGSLRVRVWERGSGITRACGTGACATAVAAASTGRTERTSRIVMDGGTLSVEWRRSDNHVYMTGPATFVFDGEVEM